LEEILKETEMRLSRAKENHEFAVNELVTMYEEKMAKLNAGNEAEAQARNNIGFLTLQKQLEEVGAQRDALSKEMRAKDEEIRRLRKEVRQKETANRRLSVCVAPPDRRRSILLTPQEFEQLQATSVPQQGKEKEREREIAQLVR